MLLTPSNDIESLFTTIVVPHVAGVWVIYMSLYAGWRSQFSALQGGDRGVMAGDAVDESLRILLMATERVERWFNTALAFISIAATLYVTSPPQTHRRPA